jgi:methylmalonyl-CoA mutase N-terminal domain/subunit
MDETLALPTEHAARVALRTQQIIAEESGVTATVDPLGGSYYVERLTLDLEKGCAEYFERLDALGGMVAAIEQGFPQREVADAAYAFQRGVDSGDRIIVGVNAFQVDDEPAPEILTIDESVGERQCASLAALRAGRDAEPVARALSALETAARNDANVMEPALDAIRAYATLGELCDTLRNVYGTYRE